MAILNLSAVLVDGSVGSSLLEEQEIKLAAGTSDTINIAITNTAGDFVDLTSSQLLLTVVSPSDISTPVISRQATVTNIHHGLGYFPLTTDDTVALTPGSYYYDVFLTDGSGNRNQVIPRSYFVVQLALGQPNQSVTVPDTQVPLAQGPAGSSVAGGIQGDVLTQDSMGDPQWTAPGALPPVTVTAGTSLTGGGTIALGASKTIGVAAGGITNTQIADSTVQNAKLAHSTVNIIAGDGLTGGGSVALGNSVTLSLGSLGPSNIADGSVTTAKIADGNVTNVKLANDSVTVTAGTSLTGGGEVALGNSVTVGVAAAGITATQLHSDAVTTTKVLDANITNAKLANPSLTVTAGTSLTGGGTVALGAAVTLGVATGGITATQLASDSVTAVKVAANAITNTKVLDGTLTNAKLQNSSITVAPGNSLTGDTSVSLGGTLNIGVADAGITSTQLAPGAITTAAIVDGSITNAKLTNSSLTVTAGTSLTGGGSVSLGGSTTVGVANNGITTTQLGPGSVTNAKLDADSVTTDKILDANVTTAKIADANVTNAKLTNSAVTVTAGTALTGGGSVALGSSTTIGVAAAGITATQLHSDAVTTSKILDANVTNAKLANNSLSVFAGDSLTGGGTVSLGGNTTIGVVDGGITNAKIADSTIANAKLVNDNITVTAGTSLTGGGLAHLGDTITVGVATGGVTATQLASNAVTTVKITDATVTNAKLANSSVTINPGNSITSGGTVALGAAITVGVANAGITTTQLADGSVTTAKVVDANITNAKLANPSLTVTAGTSLTGGGSVSLGGSTTVGVAAGGITNTQIADTTIQNAKLVNPSLTVTAGTSLSGGGSVALGAATTLNVASGGITATQLASNSVTTAKIADANVTTAKLLIDKTITPSASGYPVVSGPIAVPALSTRYIYVRTTGNDTTGDGKTTGTAYRTVAKAWTTLNTLQGGPQIIDCTGIGIETLAHPLLMPVIAGLGTFSVPVAPAHPIFFYEGDVGIQAVPNVLVTLGSGTFTPTFDATTGFITITMTSDPGWTPSVYAGRQFLNSDNVPLVIQDNTHNTLSICTDGNPPSVPTGLSYIIGNSAGLELSASCTDLDATTIIAQEVACAFTITGVDLSNATSGLSLEVQNLSNFFGNCCQIRGLEISGGSNYFFSSFFPSASGGLTFSQTGQVTFTTCYIESNFYDNSGLDLYLFGCYLHGIHLGVSNNASFKLNIDSCEIHNSSSDGVLYQGGINSLIQYTRIANSVGSGIFAAGGGSLQVLNVVGTGNGAYGIDCQSGCNVQVDDNTVITGTSGDFNVGNMGSRTWTDFRTVIPIKNQLSFLGDGSRVWQTGFDDMPSPISDTGVTPGTYDSEISITVDAQGRLTGASNKDQSAVVAENNAGYVLALRGHTQHCQVVGAGNFFQGPGNFGNFLSQCWVKPIGAEGSTERAFVGTIGDGYELGWIQSIGDNLQRPYYYVFHDTNHRELVTAIDGAHAGEVIHVAVGWDGTWQYIWVNGVLSGQAYFHGTRQVQQLGYGAPLDMTVGGGDHPNSDTNIMNFWHLEGPWNSIKNPRVAFVPEFTFSPTMFDGTTVFLGTSLYWDFQTPQRVIRDLSTLGFDTINNPGDKHDGVFFAVAGNGPGPGAPASRGWPAEPTQPITFALPTFVKDPDFPTSLVNVPTLAPAIGIPSAVPAPVGVAIWDSFCRRNRTLAWGDLPSLGSTEAGSLGALAWTVMTIGGTQNNYSWGILGAAAVNCSENSISTCAYVDVGSVNQDVQVNRKPQITEVAGHPVTDTQTGLILRAAPGKNGIGAFVYDDPSASVVRIGQIVSGSFNDMDGAGGTTEFNMPADRDWIRLRVTCGPHTEHPADPTTTVRIWAGYAAGTDLNDSPAYNWTLVGTVTGQTTNGANTKCGLLNTSVTGNLFVTTLARWVQFAAYAN